ncbi:MAG: M23 family metallopeptidase [Pricia sp.]
MADFIVEPTPRELYARQFANDSIVYAQWENAFDKTFEDSLRIELPYTEIGSFFPGNNVAYSYNLELKRGEIFHAEVQTDSLNTTLFLDLYERKSDSLNQYNLVTRSENGQKYLEKTIEKSGIYKLILQPGIHIRAPFQLRLFSNPLYAFPVIGKDNEAIQSFWGADRDGGRRSHQGVDIFADRGTPVVAATKGRISSTGERGLGGKQVWLRSGVFGNSLYYAHLDSIAVGMGKRVEIGDTLGFVGNTGNAKTTAPHLHFGIYEGYRGAIDPLPFIRINDTPEAEFEPVSFESPKITVAAARANLRNSPTTEGQPTGETGRGDTLSVLGITGKWAHVKTMAGRKAFVHRSLLAPSP